MIAIVVVLALVLGYVVSQQLGDDDVDVAAAQTVELVPAASPGPDPFTASAVPAAMTTEIQNGAVLSAIAVTVTLPPPLLATMTPVEAKPVDGVEPGLYGGSNDKTVCDPDQLVGFLAANPDKAAAWAGVHGIDPADIGDYVRGLTGVILTEDTAVTNHGFRNGQANGFQAVLQAGTAVLVDNLGVPRAKCNCGNPLGPPEPVVAGATYTGNTWSGFDPAEVVDVAPAPAPVETLEVADLDTGELIPVAVAGSAVTSTTSTTTPATTETSELAGSTSTSTTTSAAPASSTSTTTSTTTTSTPERPPGDISASGTVTASSTYEGYPAELAIDGSTASSWFSAGPGAGDPAVFTWTPAGGQAYVDTIKIVGNGNHTNPDFRTGYGFGSVTTVVHYAGGATVPVTSDLPGSPDPTITVKIDAEISMIELQFSGHEAPDCGGFSELQVIGAG